MTRMNSLDQQTDEVLPAASLEALARLLGVGNPARIASETLGGRRVWIKRYDTAPVPIFKRIHQLLSPLAMTPLVRSSPLVSPTEYLARELRKSGNFRRAGFATPDVLYHSAAVLVTAHVDHIVVRRLDELSKTDPDAHDRLLIECAAALGKVHAACLCHGRPHPRDMFLCKSGIGFLDFEEEPEAAMPLESAQARDAWLLFQQVTGRAILPETGHRAIQAYRNAAPAAAIKELRRVRHKLRFFSNLILLAARIVPLGQDGDRIVSAERLLSASFDRSPDAASCP